MDHLPPLTILLINPPLTQVNTPYPGIAFLAGWLRDQGLGVHLLDLGMVLMEALCSRRGLSLVLDRAREAAQEAEAGRRPALSTESLRFLAQGEAYLETMEPVFRFLAGGETHLAWRIAGGRWLPGGRRTDRLDKGEGDLEAGAVEEGARLRATAYLEEYVDLVRDAVDPDFGLSRYADRLGLSPASFEPLAQRLAQGPGLLDQLWLPALEERLRALEPDLVVLSLAFPGNLYGGFATARAVREVLPGAWVLGGGGWVNTELRDLEEPRVFDYFHAISYDDGYAPLGAIIRARGRAQPLEEAPLCRTRIRDAQGRVAWRHDPSLGDVAMKDTGTPWYGELLDQPWLGLLDTVNPMQRLWGERWWNKLAMAHGCYWKRCAFCDTSLDYVCRYEPLDAVTLADRMDESAARTGQGGFHFVDEAAPPAHMVRLARELRARGRTWTWWTNIRYDRHFREETCRDLARGGLVAVSGGIEVASERLLRHMGKGVSLPVLARVLRNFTVAGIMTHGYLMYGFPGQTAQETIDSLEAVRQLFAAGVLHSAYWHRLSVTAHSSLGRDPAPWGVELLPEALEGPRFARNDLAFRETGGAGEAGGPDHDRFGPGLQKALYNWMHGNMLGAPLRTWFDFSVPRPTLGEGIMEFWMEQKDA